MSPFAVQKIEDNIVIQLYFNKIKVKKINKRGEDTEFHLFGLPDLLLR